MSKKREKAYGTKFKWPHKSPLDAKDWIFLQRKYHFTPRELQIAICICHGCDNRQIAENLGIEINTVKVQLSKVYQKVGVNNKVMLLLTFIEAAKKSLN